MIGDPMRILSAQRDVEVLQVKKLPPDDILSALTHPDQDGIRTWTHLEENEPRTQFSQRFDTEENVADSHYMV